MFKKTNIKQIFTKIFSTLLAIFYISIIPVTTFATETNINHKELDTAEVYYDLITDRSAYLTSSEKDYLLIGANNLIYNGNTYVYLNIENDSFGKNVYNIMFNLYNQLYTKHNASDHIVILNYYLSDPEFDDGHLYYYDGEYGFITDEQLEKININLSKYNSRNQLGAGIKYAYNNVINMIAKNKNIPISGFDVIKSDFGSVNLSIIPSILIILILITAGFAFRKRK